MRIAVLSDIHANRPALEAVLNDSLEWDVDDYWCLGDAVGYGPDPQAGLMFLKHHAAPEGWVLGNHDAMLADLVLPQDPAAPGDAPAPLAFEIREKDDRGRETDRVLYAGRGRGKFLAADDWRSTGVGPIRAIELNRAALAGHAEADAFWQAEFTPARAAPRPHSLDGIDHLLVHSGQVSHLFRYIYAWQAEFYLPMEFERLRARARAGGCPQVQWYGHTHVPTLVLAGPAGANGREGLRAVRILPGETYPLDGELALVNPGSVGQPRDLDQRAAYAVLDTRARSVTFRRVEYDWRETARRLLNGGYPESLVLRLSDAPAIKDTPDDWLAHYRRAREVTA